MAKPYCRERTDSPHSRNGEQPFCSRPILAVPPPNFTPQQRNCRYSFPCRQEAVIAEGQQSHGLGKQPSGDIIRCRRYVALMRSTGAALDISYERISGALRSLLLVWASLEKAVRHEVVRAHGHLPPRAHGIAAAFRTWESSVAQSQPANSLGPLLAAALRSQLQMPLDVRNGLCHGLVGISAANENMQATLRWEMNDERHAISWDDLQEQLKWLSRLPQAVSVISRPSLERPGNRATNTAENRAWWRSEFSLDVPEP